MPPLRPHPPRRTRLAILALLGAAAAPRAAAECLDDTGVTETLLDFGSATVATSTLHQPGGELRFDSECGVPPRARRRRSLPPDRWSRWDGRGCDRSPKSLRRPPCPWQWPCVQRPRPLPAFAVAVAATANVAKAVTEVVGAAASRSRCLRLWIQRPRTDRGAWDGHTLICSVDDL